MRYCKQCHSPRHDVRCHKCREETIIPHKDWHFPDLPNVNRVRELARFCGYAIGEHGTKERDLDVIAAPWVEQAVPADILIEFICGGMNAKVVSKSEKPLGRKAYSLQVDGYFKILDISVMPRNGN